MLTKFENYIYWKGYRIDLDDSDRILSFKDSSIVIQKEDRIVKKFKERWEFDITVKCFPLDDIIFPKIYDINDPENEITLEILNTKKAEKEYNKINTYLKKEYNITLYKLLLKSLVQHLNKKSKHIDVIFPDNLVIIFNKFQFLIDKVRNIINNVIGDEYYLLDVHSENFGYDKNGNLKMFDI